MAREAEHSKEHWRIQGSGKLSPRGLAALRLLWQWRDSEASIWDRPCFMVLGNAELLNWSTSLQNRQSVIIPPRYQKIRRHRLEEALAQFHAMPESDYPQRIKGPRRIKDDSFDAKVAALIQRRDKKASELDLEPSFVASRSTLETIVRNEEEGISLLMNWQRQILGFQRN